jgi:hypothetical protein
MKFKNSVEIDICVYGQENELCGTKNNKCRFHQFQKDGMSCILFKSKIEYSADHWNHMRCKKCKEVFGK